MSDEPWKFFSYIVKVIYWVTKWGYPKVLSSWWADENTDAHFSLFWLLELNDFIRYRLWQGWF